MGSQGHGSHRQTECQKEKQRKTRKRFIKKKKKIPADKKIETKK